MCGAFAVPEQLDRLYVPFNSLNAVSLFYLQCHNFRRFSALCLVMERSVFCQREYKVAEVWVLVKYVQVKKLVKMLAKVVPHTGSNLYVL